MKRGSIKWDCEVEKEKLTLMDRILPNLTAFGIVSAALVLLGFGIQNDLETSFADLANPSAHIVTQIDAVAEQAILADDAEEDLTPALANGPKLFQAAEDALAPEKLELMSVNHNLAQVVEELSEELEGRYLFIDVPQQLSKDLLASLPEAKGGEEFQCLAEALYFEARGESLKGQRAVAEVILNRVNSSKYPDTICGVVNQGTGKKYQCQFSYTCDGIPERVNEKTAYSNVAKVARLMMDVLYEEHQITHGALFYHTSAVNPDWARVKKLTTRLGTHLFYR